MAHYSVYLVRCRDGSLYTGIALDVARRIREHEGGANLCLGDGSVRFFAEGIDHQVYSAMGTRAGHEALSQTP